MKLLVIGCCVALGCGNKTSSNSACADAIAKGVDRMVAARDKQLADAPADIKPKLEERAKRMTEVTGKLKAAITTRCVEDKWPVEVVDCYATATSMPDMKACRTKLSAELSSKLQADEMQVMMTAMGGAAPPPAPVAADTDVAKLEAQMQELEANVKQAMSELAAVQNEADRKVVADRLVTLQKQHDELVAKLAVAHGGSAVVAPSCDAEALKTAGAASESTGQHAAALDQFERAIQCKADATLYRLAFMAACNSGSAGKARLYYKLLAPDQQRRLAAICTRNGITQLDGP